MRDSGYIENTKILKECGIVLGNLSFPTKASNHLLLPLYQKVIEPHLQKVLNRPDFNLGSFAAETDNAQLNSHISGLPAAVVSQALGLSARSLVLDAACATSLYAVALACHYLHTKKTDLMLAGAVSAADPFFVNMGFRSFRPFRNLLRLSIHLIIIPEVCLPAREQECLFSNVCVMQSEMLTKFMR